MEQNFGVEWKAMIARMNDKNRGVVFGQEWAAMIARVNEKHKVKNVSDVNKN